MKSIKINRLEAENVKRIKAIKVEPTPNGLTIIGGNNRQGKTSVLDAITWALGGNRYKPSDPQHRDSVIPPNIRVELSNGLIVERKGKNSALKVIDPQGNAAGQTLLDDFISELALDLPKFMSANSKDKADTLLRIIGVGDKLHELERQGTEIYNRRHAIGQIADQKIKYAKEQTEYKDAPKDLISASELIKQQQEILARNGENQRKRENLKQLELSFETNMQEILYVQKQMDKLTKKYNELVKRQLDIDDDIEIAEKTVKQLQDESTAELEKSIADIDEINRKVRANLDKEKAEDDAQEYKNQYDTLTAQLESVRKQKRDLLNGAQLPLEGLSVEDGELTYNGDKWDGMAGSDQLIVATAIVRRLKPNCGFVLLDKLEQMDLNTLNSFGAWLESEGLQAIATRVSTGDECSIIIEDGYAVQDQLKENKTALPKWKAGEF